MFEDHKDLCNKHMAASGRPTARLSHEEKEHRPCNQWHSEFKAWVCYPHGHTCWIFLVSDLTLQNEMALHLVNKSEFLHEESLPSIWCETAAHFVTFPCYFLLIAQALVNSAGVWVPQHYQNQLRFRNEKLPEVNYTADCGMLNDVNAWLDPRQAARWKPRPFFYE